MVRVVVTDFLPFIKAVFDNLYSKDRVSQLALIGSAFSLRHQAATPSVRAGTQSSVRGSAGCLSLKMDLDVVEIASPLKSVAPGVFQEIEAAAKEKLLKEDVLMAEVASGLEEFSASPGTEKEVDVVVAPVEESDSTKLEGIAVECEEDQKLSRIIDAAQETVQNSDTQGSVVEQLESAQVKSPIQLV